MLFLFIILIIGTIIGIVFSIIKQNYKWTIFYTVVSVIILPTYYWIVPSEKVFPHDQAKISSVTVSSRPIASFTPNPVALTYGTSYPNAAPIGFDTDINNTFEKNTKATTLEHWYYIDVTEDINLSAELSGEQSMNMSLYLYPSDGKNYLTYDYGTDKLLSISEPLQPGRFYIKITCKDVFGLYKLKLSKAVSSYQNDVVVSGNNDSFQNAIPIKLNQEYEGHLGYYSAISRESMDAVDWYMITVDEPSIVTFSCLGDPFLNMSLILYQSDGSNSLYSQYGKNQTLEFTCALQAGNYYIVVSQNDNFGGYKLSSIVSVPQIKSDAEPNDSFQYPIKLSPNHTATGQIGYQNNKGQYDSYDWYCIQLNTGNISISLSPQNSNGYIYFDLYDKNANKSILRDYGQDEIITKTANKLEPGTYFIRVSSSSPTYGEYTLQYQSS